MKQGTVSTFIRKLKIAFRLLLVCALGYGVLLVVSIGSMYASHGQRVFGSTVEAAVFFPQRFLPSPGQIPNKVHWFVCAAWVFTHQAASRHIEQMMGI